MATAIGTPFSQERAGWTSEIISEVRLDEQETNPQLEELPEDTVTPDDRTTQLIADVKKVADEFRPAHEKLNKTIDTNRGKILSLKKEFGVIKGSGGHHLLIDSNGKKVAMLWNDFVPSYFGVSPRRINQLLYEEKPGTKVKGRERRKSSDQKSKAGNGDPYFHFRQFRDEKQTFVQELAAMVIQIYDCAEAPGIGLAFDKELKRQLKEFRLQSVKPEKD